MIAGREIKIKPFVLRNRATVIRTLFEIYVAVSKNRPDISPDDLKEMAEGKTSTAGLGLIPVLIDASEGKLVDLYVAATGQPKEWLLDSVQISDEVEIIKAILEVNDIRPLISQVKSLVQGINAKKTS